MRQRTRAIGRRSRRASRQWGHELGFEAVGIADTDLAAEEAQLLNWLAAGRHGEMDYMARHGARRARPAELVPGTLRVITARLNYWPAARGRAADVLADLAARVRRALRARPRLSQGAARAASHGSRDRIAADVGPFGYRVFTDSAPVLEVALAAKAGLGWRGKHTLLLTRDAGSYFFLGEIYTDLPLPDHARRRGALRHVHARASTPARPARSSRRTSSTRAAASRT